MSRLLPFGGWGPEIFLMLGSNFPLTFAPLFYLGLASGVKSELDSEHARVFLLSGVSADFVH